MRKSSLGFPGESILKDVQPYSRLDPEAYRLAVSRYFHIRRMRLWIENAFQMFWRGNPLPMKPGNEGREFRLYMVQDFCNPCHGEWNTGQEWWG